MSLRHQLERLTTSDRVTLVAPSTLVAPCTLVEPRTSSAPVQSCTKQVAPGTRPICLHQIRCRRTRKAGWVWDPRFSDKRQVPGQRVYTRRVKAVWTPNWCDIHDCRTGRVSKVLYHFVREIFSSWNHWCK